jgi:hypothetical protein
MYSKALATRLRLPLPLVRVIPLLPLPLVRVIPLFPLPLVRVIPLRPLPLGLVIPLRPLPLGLVIPRLPLPLWRVMPLSSSSASSPSTTSSSATSSSTLIPMSAPSRLCSTSNVTSDGMASMIGYLFTTSRNESSKEKLSRCSILTSLLFTS